MYVLGIIVSGMLPVFNIRYINFNLTTYSGVIKRKGIVNESCFANI